MRSAVNQGLLTGISETKVKLIFYNLLNAINFMHQANVLHRDLKPGNVLINEECEIKICDFGIARTLPESHLGKGSGNTSRLRENIFKRDLKLSRRGMNDAIVKELNEENEQLKDKKRSLSTNIGSRWYRAPEISLIEK